MRRRFETEATQARAFDKNIMASPSNLNTPSESAEIEQIITEIFAKSLHIILEARVPGTASSNSFGGDTCSSTPSSTTSVSSIRPRDKWFNLALRECPDALENLELWSQSNLELLVVDVILTHRQLNHDVDLDLPSVVSSLLQSSSEKDICPIACSSEKDVFLPVIKEKIVERWIVQYENHKSGLHGRNSGSGSKKYSGSSSSSEMSSSCKKVYRKSILLMRSLYATLRLLPAYKVYGDLCSSSRIRPFLLEHRVSSFFEPFSRSEDAEMNQFAFTPIETPCGRLSISVLYLPSLDEMCSEPSTPISAQLIPDYVGSPLAEPVKRLPSLPASEAAPSKVLFTRRHSWSYDHASAPSVSLSPPPYSDSRALHDHHRLPPRSHANAGNTSAKRQISRNISLPHTQTTGAEELWPSAPLSPASPSPPRTDSDFKDPLHTVSSPVSIPLVRKAKGFSNYTLPPPSPKSTDKAKINRTRILRRVGREAMASLVGSPLLRVRVLPEVASPLFRPLPVFKPRFPFRHRCFSISASLSSASAAGDGEVRVRFAPSPTGNLHVGGARTALFNYLFARSKGGKFILRIEDTDLERSTKKSEEAMLHDLTWLGLDWDEGPGVGGEFGPYRQSERNSLYKEYAEKLLDSGYVYRCFCSNEELEQMKEIAKLKQLPPVYTGKWATATDVEVQEELAKGTPFTYRFHVPKEGAIKINDLIRGEVTWNLDTLGDFVILRSNGQPVYNFCVTVDDATMHISHVIRAEEHLPNTLRQALIYKALGFPMPSFAHVSLILAPDRSKLSKRHGATSVGQFRDMGYLPQAMNNYLALLGWGDGTENELFSIEELVEKFTIERVNKSGAVFDSAKLRWMNGQYLRALPSEKLTELLGGQWKSAGFLLDSEGTFVTEAAQLLKDSIDLIADADSAMTNLLSYPLHSTLASEEAKNVIEDRLAEVASSFVTAYDSGEIQDALEEGPSGWQKWVKSFGKSQKRKGKSLFMPLRLLLTGKLHGPDFGASILLIYNASKGGVLSPQANFIPLAERIRILKELNWESLNKPVSPLEPIATAS